MREIDLHGLSPDQALRRLAQELHACRVLGLDQALVITGRGWGNARREPVLRGHVEVWLETPEARSLGVRGWRRTAKGGALEVRLGRPRA